MSRLLDALRNLQQSSDSADSPPRKVTPRLASSIRKAVLGAAAEATVAPEPPLLFQLPDVSEPVAAAVQIEEPKVVPTPAQSLQPDPLELVDSIQASLSSMQDESLVVSRPEAPARDTFSDAREFVSAEIALPEPAASVEVPPAAEVQQSAIPSPSQSTVAEDQSSEAAVEEPVFESLPEPVFRLPPVAAAERPRAAASASETLPFRARPQPTPGEYELAALLTDGVTATQFRNLLSAVERDVAGIASPVVAIVGLEEHDATARFAAAVAMLSTIERAKTTLLLEGNFNRDLAKLFGLPHARGLCESLACGGGRKEVIVPTSQEQLDLLPMGRATAAQAIRLPQVLGTEIAQLRTGYDMIVVDAGPLSSPWALALSQAATVVYLLVQLGNTSAELASASVTRFRSAGGKLSGCLAIE